MCSIKRLLYLYHWLHLYYFWLYLWLSACATRVQKTFLLLRLSWKKQKFGRHLSSIKAMELITKPWINDIQNNFHFSKTGATSNMNKKSDLFLPTNIFNVKTLEKIGNGNFGIVFKVKMLRKMATLGKVQHTYSKVVAVKKSTQIWDIHDEECDAMKNIVEFLEGPRIDFILKLFK